MEALQALVDNPAHDITVSIDGGASFSVKGGYQDAFVAEAGTGDWDGPILFFRYLYSGLSVGTHTFEFTIVDLEFGISEVITVEVIP